MNNLILFTLLVFPPIDTIGKDMGHLAGHMISPVRRKRENSAPWVILGDMKIQIRPKLINNKH